MEPGKNNPAHPFFGIPHMTGQPPPGLFHQAWPTVNTANSFLMHPMSVAAPSPQHAGGSGSLPMSGPTMSHNDHRHGMAANAALQRIVKSPESNKVQYESEDDEGSSDSGSRKKSRREDDSGGDEDRTKKRREQIAAASRASRARRKRELEDLRTETKQLKQDRENLMESVRKLQKKVEDLQVRPLVIQEAARNAISSRFPNVLRELSNSVASVAPLLTHIRDKVCLPADYVNYSNRLCRLLAEEAIASSRIMQATTVTTPTNAEASGVQFPEFDKECCLVSIMRSGDILADAIRSVIPHVPVGKFLIQRQEDSVDKHAVLHWSKLPRDIAHRFVFLCDPMLGTGGTAVLCIKELVKCGVSPRNILFLNVVSCPEGLTKLASEFSEVQVVTCNIDECLNEQRYIVPGLGDFGDRYYHTTH